MAKGQIRLRWDSMSESGNSTRMIAAYHPVRAAPVRAAACPRTSVRAALSHGRAAAPVPEGAHLPAGDEDCTTEEEHRDSTDPARVRNGPAVALDPAHDEPRQDEDGDAREDKRRHADAFAAR